MSQNYIKSLKVDEYAWQTIYFRGSIGKEPGHLALVWYTPRQEDALRYCIKCLGNHLDEPVYHHIICMVGFPDHSYMYIIHYILSTEWSVTKGHHLRSVHYLGNRHNCPKKA